MKWEPPKPKTKRWQAQVAKAKLSHLLDLAESQSDQTITRHGKPVAVLISIEKYEKLTGATGRPGLLEALLACPPGPELKIQRDRSDRVPKGPPLFG